MGAEALRLCQGDDDTIDLVVSDIVMPELNGIELAKRILAARPRDDVFIKGFGDQFPELRELTKNGANILEKPFPPPELLRKVEDALNQGRAATGTEG
jgi:two-component system, cell cycle sensor histidine kinase and response regulator CckA